MTDTTNIEAAKNELSIEELKSVAGGEFSWKGLLGAMAGGAGAGFVGGSVVGGAGAGPGAAAGGLLGGISYCIGSIIDLF